MDRLGLAWLGLVWLGVAWLGLARGLHLSGLVVASSLLVRPVPSQFLFIAKDVLDLLETSSGLTTLLAQQQALIETALTPLLASQLAQVETLTNTLITQVQDQVTTQLQTQVSTATDEIVNSAANCILPSSSGATLSTSSSAIDLLSAASSLSTSSLSTSGLSDCLTGAVNEQLSGLTATVTQTVADALGVSGGNAGIDVATIKAQLQPLLQQALLTAFSAIPGVQNVIESTGLPQSSADLLAAAQDVAYAIWDLLPLPAPVTITLINGLDKPGTTRHEYMKPSTPGATPTPQRNGANLTAPLTGYALSVSSEATNVLSGMSSCTLEGYARVEPSPRGMQHFLYTGLLTPPTPVVPNFVDDADEAASYFSSALWQPFPFNNFNFFMDNPAFVNSIDTRDVSQCKKTYLTRGSSAPVFWDAGGRLPKDLMATSCPGEARTCTLNVPHDTSVWLDRYRHVGDLKQQSPDDKCINEFATMYGPDPLPSLGVLSYGGMISITDHIQCLHCFQKQGLMNAECSYAASFINTNPENEFTDRNSSLQIEIGHYLCDYYHDLAHEHPGASLGQALHSFFLEPSNVAYWAAALNMTADQFYGIWSGAPALEFLEKLTTETGWNACQSQRFKREVNPGGKAHGASRQRVIRDYSPLPFIDVQINGVPSKQGFADFGGHAPELEIRDKNPTGKWEWTPIVIDAIINAPAGRWQLVNIQVQTGGSRRVLDLEILLDGVPAGVATNSWWEFDNEIEYVNPHALSFSKISILFLTGHDAFRLFAVLTIPLMFLNVRGRNRRAPGLIASGFALPCVLLFQW